MASNHTSNYDLSQWEATDGVLRVDFNEDNAKIDGALRANAEAITQETNARISALNSEATIRAQADQEEAAVRAEAVNSILAQLSEKGNLQVEFMSYSGKGTYGEENMNTLTFPTQPLLVLIAGHGVGILAKGYDGLIVLFNGNVSAASGSWSNNNRTYSWYATNADKQMNRGGKTYQVIAFYALGK